MDAQLAIMRDQMADSRTASIEQDKFTARTIAALEKQATALTTSIGPATLSTADSAKASANAAQDSARSANSTATTATRQLDAIDRPILRLLAVPAQPIVFSDKGVDFAFVVGYANVGRSAMTALYVGAAIEMRTFNLDERRKQVLEVCKTADAVMDNVSQLPALPGDQGARPISEFVDTQRVMASAQPRGFRWMLPGRDYISPTLVGCAGFRAQNSGKRHHTWFSYDINRRAELYNDIRGGNTFIEIGKDVPIDQILLVPSFAGFGSD
jgi:hypothetical protein